MAFLLKTYSSNPDFNGDCDYALVDLGRESLDLTLERIGLAQDMYSEDHSFNALEYSDYSARYVSWSEELEDLLGLDAMAKVNDGVLVTLNSRLALPEKNYQQVEGEYIVVSTEGVSWKCIPKHSDVTVETMLVGWRELLDYQRAIEHRRHKDD